MIAKTNREHLANFGTRSCDVCGVEFVPVRPWQHLCKKTSCAKERQRRNYKEFQEYRRNREAFLVWLSEQVGA